MSTKTLTGKRRFRTVSRMFSTPLVVLQVEVYIPSTYDFPFDQHVWRDATVEDLTLVEKPVQ